MRVHVVDPSAYTPPYDHALCTALARAGAQVELVTSEFAYGDVPPPVGYEVRRHFYGAAAGRAGGGPRRAAKLVQHVPDMLRYRRLARAADIVHFQWLAVQHVDRRLLPGSRPLVLTAHDVLPREPRVGQVAAQRRLYDRFDAVVVHSREGARRLAEEVEVPADRIHVIPHGTFDYLGEAPPDASLPPELTATPEDRPVVLCFGLMRPYKGIDVLLEAWRGLESEAELWVVGHPRMDISKLVADAPSGVLFVPRYLPDEQVSALFRRADLVVLPYLAADQSGVMFTALAFGAPVLASAVGGFRDVAETGAARLVAPGNVDELRTALRDLLADPGARERMGAAARAAAESAYSWDTIAAQHLELYGRLVS
jgi:glycosyltransferase involved in cell wall biosynthesis